VVVEFLVQIQLSSALSSNDQKRAAQYHEMVRNIQIALENQRNSSQYSLAPLDTDYDGYTVAIKVIPEMHPVGST
jgi:hypothetical protein